MPWLLNALYLLILLFLSPWLLYRAVRTQRYRLGLRAKLLGLPGPLPVGPRRPVWFHGVSVGEVHLLRQVIARFRQRFPGWPIVVSTTTDTGLVEAQRCFADLPVFPFPFDFSWAVERTLKHINPALIVLAESELWPNFLGLARARGVPVAIINGRMSPRTFGRYRLLGGLARWLLGHIDLIAVQSEAFAASLCALGVDPGRVHVTGSVKYDGAATERNDPRTLELRRLLSLSPDQLIWVAGSTQTPEEEIALRIYQRLKPEQPRLRLVLVPRHRERFEEVARLVQAAGLPLVRRSQLGAGAGTPPADAVILLDTIGELSALWGAADLAFVGGSLDGKRGGQNMIEPAAYGAAVLFGPHVWNFRDTVSRLLEADGAVQVADARELEQLVRRLLENPHERVLLASAARRLTLSQQGATERTLGLLGQLMVNKQREKRAA